MIRKESAEQVACSTNAQDLPWASAGVVFRLRVGGDRTIRSQPRPVLPGVEDSDLLIGQTGRCPGNPGNPDNWIPSNLRSAASGGPGGALCDAGVREEVEVAMAGCRGPCWRSLANEWSLPPRGRRPASRSLMADLCPWLRRRGVGARTTHQPTH
jgi:hypothetical protein